MPKKIYDVMPPKPAPKEKNIDLSARAGKLPITFKETPKESRNIQKPLKETSPKKARRFPVKEICIGGLLIVILIGIYFAAKLAKADIEIWPKVEDLTIQERITADTSAKAVDLPHKVIPAQYIEQEQESWQEFEATGSSSNNTKSTGKIIIYNKISPATSFTLKIGTHFLSDSGKYFVTLEKITIPAMKKNQAGSIEVKVDAQDAGADYNIGPSKFSVPKLSGTAYYYSIFAESKEDMSGGSTGTVKKVTKDDIENAKNSLTQKLLGQAEEALRNRLSQDDILLEGAISKDVIITTADIKPDALIDKFTQSAKVKVSALVFKRSDLEEIIKDSILTQLPESQTFLENNIDINYSPELIDISAGKETLDLQLTAKTYNRIDVDSLTNLMARKSVNEIRSIVDGKYGDEISNVKINLWPFWVKKAPQDKNRIHVDLKFE